MNTINLENQNQIDDLRVQRAISGLTEQEFARLLELLESGQPTAEDSHTRLVESGIDEFTEFDQCVALVDVWLAGNSGVTLGSEQRRRLFDQFAGSSPDRNVDSKHRRRTTANRRWFLSSILVAAAICIALASISWMNQPTKSIQDVAMSAVEMRKKMLANPPEDMLRWVWNGGSDMEMEPRFLGDVIWSDVLQQGFALMNVTSPIADPALYQLQLFQIIENEIGEGVLCGEFRFDGYSTPFVVMIRPDKTVSRPHRFTVSRSPEEPSETAGPNGIEEVTLIAEANVKATVLEETIAAEDSDAVISQPHEEAF